MMNNGDIALKKLDDNQSFVLIVDILEAYAIISDSCLCF